MLLLLKRTMIAEGMRYKRNRTSDGTIVPDHVIPPLDAKVWDGKNWVDVPRKAKDSKDVDEAKLHSIINSANAAALKMRKEDETLFEKDGKPKKLAGYDPSTQSRIEHSQGNQPAERLAEADPKKVLGL